MIFKKGDLVAGVEMESDCIGVVVALPTDGVRAGLISVRWLYHWDEEESDQEFDYISTELRPLNVESEER